MRFHQVLDRLKAAIVIPHRGIGEDCVRIRRQDLIELLNDWQRLDRQVRDDYLKKQGK